MGYSHINSFYGDHILHFRRLHPNLLLMALTEQNWNHQNLLGGAVHLFVVVGIIQIGVTVLGPA